MGSTRESKTNCGAEWRIHLSIIQRNRLAKIECSPSGIISTSPAKLAALAGAKVSTQVAPASFDRHSSDENGRLP